MLKTFTVGVLVGAVIALICMDGVFQKRQLAWRRNYLAGQKEYRDGKS